MVTNKNLIVQKKKRQKPKKAHRFIFFHSEKGHQYKHHPVLVLLQERQEVFLLKICFNEVTTDRDQLVRKQQHTQKISFFSFFGFKKLTEKSGPTLRMIPNAEDADASSLVPSTEQTAILYPYYKCNLKLSSKLSN